MAFAATANDYATWPTSWTSNVVHAATSTASSYYQPVEPAAAALSPAAYARLHLERVSGRPAPPPAVYASLAPSERPLAVRRSPRTRGHIGWVRRAPARRVR